MARNQKTSSQQTMLLAAILIGLVVSLYIVVQAVTVGPATSTQSRAGTVTGSDDVFSLELELNALSQDTTASEFSELQTLQ